MTWRFQIYNLYREIFKFCNLTKVPPNFEKFIIVYITNFNISGNKLYNWNLQITSFKMIYNMFMF